MNPIRVLVVDDSILAREVISAILSSDRDITVVGEAVNGRDAVEKAVSLKPDIVTMDIEMPVMDGLEAIEQIMAVQAVPILVVTTHGDANTAYAAIAKGALDLVMKPDINLEGSQDFINKVKLLSRIKVITHLRGRHALKERGEKTVRPSPFSGETLGDRVFAIASSTGGPEALSVILSGIPRDFNCPILIAQHIADGFVSGMVEWLAKLSKVRVKVAEDAETVIGGTVYVSPSEKHMEVAGTGKIFLRERHPKDIFRPSCDLLLTAVASVFGARSVGIILTGMGNDGVLGMKKIKEAGGTTIAQDEQSSVLFGMPKMAIEGGFIHKILSLEEILEGMLHLAGYEKRIEMGGGMRA